MNPSNNNNRFFVQRGTVLACCALWAGCALAGPDQPGTVANPAAPARAPSLGEQLDAQGIAVHGFGSWYSLYNTYGVGRRQDQNNLFLMLAADFDLEKLLGVKGASVHLKQSYAPVASNVDYGPALGDIYGAVAPFVPKKARLVQLSYEQRLLEDALKLELGRSNPATSFMQPACAFVFTCFNPLTLMNGSVFAYPFAYWSATARYNFDDNRFAQVGGWLLNGQIPFESGWNWREERHDGRFFLAQVGTQTRFGEALYPSRFELALYRSTKKQPNPSRTVAGTSTLLDRGSAPKVQEHADGILFNWQKTVYRADGGSRPFDTNPRSLTLEGGLSSSLTPGVTGGVDAFGFIGVNALNVIPGRPLDSLGARLSWFRVSKDYQARLKDAGRLSGSAYEQPRDSFVAELNGRFVLGSGVTLDPFINYVLQPSRYQNPFAEQRPASGWLFGLGLNFALDPLLGWRH
ncbi:MAG: carbohydrate porin [Pseudomonas piscis]|uniref:carbohydrate porin n=1 Tax=Pseudomonas piscis TaxID=2614538 RepID=UPI003D26A55F